MMTRIATVIVGHGKSAVGKGWGTRIDRALRVIRMWDCQWQDANDYGTKYDLGVFEIGHGMIKKWRSMNERQPKDGWLASVCSSERAIGLPDFTMIVDQGKWNQDAMAMGGRGATGRLQFQRGVVAACWAIENSRRRDRIILVGFDNVSARKALSKEDGFPEEYLKQPTTFHFNGYVVGAERYGNHDFSIEGAFLQKLAREHGVFVEHADVRTRW